MESGIDFEEQYFNPFGNLAKFYYGTNLHRHLRRVQTKQAPGNFEYISVNTDLLGWVLERATKKSVPTLLEQRVWQPFGAEHDASWSIDSKRHGVPKYSYGLNLRSSDLLHLGRLYLHGGTTNDHRIVSREWIDRMDRMDPEKEYQPNYKNHWWRDVELRDTYSADEDAMLLNTYESIGEDGEVETFYRVYSGKYYAAGFLGQFVYVCPERETVIVRTGKRQGKTDWIGLFRTIAYQ